MKFFLYLVDSKKLLQCASLVCALCCLGANGQQADQPCFRETGARGVEACTALARSVMEDRSQVQALAHTLEIAGRYAAAASVYKTAIETYAYDKSLLQGLIRSRRELKASQVLAALTDGTQAAAESASIVVGRSRALVIGNNRYANFPQLQTPIADANAVVALLEDGYGFSVTKLINASRYDVLKALSQLRRELKENDKLLVYYAGHGYLDEATQRGYWLPVDAERDNSANWISTDDITDTLAGVAAKHAIVIADSCFSGSLLRASPTLNRDQGSTPASRRSRTVLTSGGLEPVLDDGVGQHSIFARAFLDVLNDNQGALKARRLFVSLRDQVALHADQTPQYAPIRKAGHEGGDFVFVRQ